MPAPVVPLRGRVGRLVGVHRHRRRAVGDRGDLAVIGHSLGGFTAPLVCARLPAKLLVLVAGMIPEGAVAATAWPETPTRYLLCRDDRMFSAAWARRHAHERLGIAADEIDGRHYIALSRPRELAEHLHAYAAACS